MGWRIPKVMTNGKIEGKMHLPPHKIELYDDCLMIDKESIPLQNIIDVNFRADYVNIGFLNNKFEPRLYIILIDGRKFEFRGWKFKQEKEYHQIAEFVFDYIKYKR